MAPPSNLLLLPLLFFAISELPSYAAAQNNGTVFVGSSLSTGDAPWLSPSADFAFGFRRVDNASSSNYLLAIWYNKVPDRTIVWYANGDSLAPGGSKVDLTSDSGLVLSNPQGGQLWRSEFSFTGVANYGFMNDTGNFVIRKNRDSDPLWESFNEPRDTMLPSQKMETYGVMYSRRTETSFSKGRFQLRLLPDGNLVLNIINMDTDWAYDAYYISGTYDPSSRTNSGYQFIFNATGYMYILKRNGVRFDLTPGRVNPVTDYYHRATLSFDGTFTQYYHPKNSTAGGAAGWKPVWTEPENICVNIDGVKGSGACGFNSICSLGEDQRPICACPQGFSLFDKNDTYGSCKPNFVQDCGEDHGVDSGSADEMYDFMELQNTDWPTSDYEQLKPSNEEECRKSCMRDCMCAVAIFRDDSCWKKKLPLSNGREDSSVNGKALIKVRKDGSPPLAPNPRNYPVPGDKRKDGNQGTLVVVGSVLLGSSVLVLMVTFCIGFSFIHHKKLRTKNPNAESNKEELGTNLRCFAYEELVEATDGFKEELGRGSFGIVYKGALKLGVSGATLCPIAVKKLDRALQDTEKEFRTEVNVIGKTHHKNLVPLLGFCDQGLSRLLVYELMSNGTLASFLFGEMRPSWNQRAQIAVGIARGLLYLHEECSSPIIHCDIKPQNILLDEYYCPRISDFGLAKLLMINQSHTQTAIRGTKGYVAPEWFRRNTSITAKIDVYSFGVLLMEVVCCHRILDLEIGDRKGADLTEWAYDCFREGRLDALVEDDREAMSEYVKVERFVKAGLWCIQEDPSLRPTMRKVTQMLEGVVEVAVPPCPFPPSSSLS